MAVCAPVDLTWGWADAKDAADDSSFWSVTNVALVTHADSLRPCLNSRVLGGSGPEFHLGLTLPAANWIPTAPRASDNSWARWFPTCCPCSGRAMSSRILARAPVTSVCLLPGYGAPLLLGAASGVVSHVAWQCCPVDLTGHRPDCHVVLVERKEFSARQGRRRIESIGLSNCACCPAAACSQYKCSIAVNSKGAQKHCAPCPYAVQATCRSHLLGCHRRVLLRRGRGVCR